MPQILDWRAASQNVELLRPVIGSLERGELIALPTESGYLVVGDASNLEATKRLRNGPRGETARLTTLTFRPDTAFELAGITSRRFQRVLNRLWPGPLEVATPNHQMPVRCPRHSVFDVLASAIGGPLITCESGYPAGTIETAQTVLDQWNDAVAIGVDAGVIETKVITRAALSDQGWRIEREGAISQEAFTIAAAQWIVFVCTGNTCRSPMAEAIFKDMLADRIGCRVEELPARGYQVSSAGVAAYPGDGPTPEAVEALRELEIDLSPHRSQPLPMDLVAQADQLIAMTRSHLLAVLTRYPAIGGTMRLLCGADGDLDDPIGGETAVYTACAKTIYRHSVRILEELVR